MTDRMLGIAVKCEGHRENKDL